MTGWDVLDKFLGGLTPVAIGIFLITAVSAAAVFVVGFARHGVDFIKHGFKQTALDSSLEKRFDSLEGKFDSFDDKLGSFATKLVSFEGKLGAFEIKLGSFEGKLGALESRFDSLEGKLELIETNHFTHLKNYLGILNGVLLDREIIDNQTRARMDNELRGM